MRTIKLFFFLAAAFFACAGLRAQVTIGSSENPRAGAILDLNSAGKGGLLLSNVFLTEPGEIPDSFPGADGADVTALKAGLRGALVYNTNPEFCTGIQVWNGNFWERIASGPPLYADGTLTITSSTARSLGGDEIEFTAAPGATTYRWYASTHEDDYEYIGITKTNTFSAPFPAGNNKVKVIMDDCRSLKASNMVSFTPDALSPNFGGEAGGNIIYVYGDFPYAATSEYEQDGLVAHFDGINNLGLGDKQHDFNTTNWKDLKNAFYLHKGGYAEGQWLSNGFQSRNDSTSFTYTGNFPAAYPTGNHGRTVEVIFRTPVAANMFVQETEIQRVIFRYGGNAQTLQFGILYRGLSETISTHEVICLDDPGNPWIFYAIAGNTRNLITCLSSTPSLETPNTINTVTSTYANSIQDEDSTNSYINNLFSPPALREGTILDTPLSGTISIGRYLSGSTFLSVRLYDRVLDRDEIKHNAALDQKRYLTPPTVTIGGNACEEVVVLSPHFLMCKVPAGTLGLQNVTVVSDGVTTTYNGAYRYVDNSAFYINTISPIVGTANQTGQTLTLTGNKLEDIATVEVDGDECTYDSTDSDGAYKYTLPVKLVAGETDIMITLIGGEVYRFAKVFEYK